MDEKVALLIIAPEDPLGALPAVEAALAGQCTLVPVAPDKADDPHALAACEATVPEGTALLMGTSGSTGAPKYAALSAAGLLAAADASAAALGGHGQWVLSLPAHHIAGMQILVRSLRAGTAPIPMDLSQGFNVEDFFHATSRAKEAAAGRPLFCSLTPMLITKILDTPGGAAVLASYHSVLVGGGAVRPEIHARAAEAGITMVETYGSSETSGGVVYNGRALPGVSIELEGEDGTHCGRVLLRGPMIAQGYVNAPNDCFPSPGSWLSSDRGRITDDGCLQIIGRADSLIETGGLKVQPESVEQVFAAVPGVTGVCALGLPDATFGNRLVLAWSGGATEDVIHEAAQSLPGWMRPKNYYHWETLPTTALGKVARHVVREQLMHGA
ncbi:MAG: AMP-binding protein [Corynebacterium sp.]|nr:AMP-binding protein [Corynebacterium sp.]